MEGGLGRTSPSRRNCNGKYVQKFDRNEIYPAANLVVKNLTGKRSCLKFHYLEMKKTEIN